jgi:hypothetical protein
MSRSLARLVGVGFCLSLAGSASAQLCEPVHYVADGIGDGCSSPGGFVSDVLLFRGVFTPSCDQHDQCYSTLGSSVDHCDNEFWSNMRSACRDNYDPFWMAPFYAACVTVASQYYTFVRGYGALHHPYPEIQRNILNLSRALQSRVEAGTCGTAPELTNLYRPELIDDVNNAWLASAGRLPTIYEFLAAVNDGPGWGIVENYAQWHDLMLANAQGAASVHPPELTITSPRDSTTQYIALTLPPTVVGSLRLNWWGSDFGLLYAEPLHQPLWNVSWYIEGFAQGRDLQTGVRNLKMFKVRVFEKGSCGPYYGKPVYDPDNPICLE